MKYDNGPILRFQSCSFSLSLFFAFAYNAEIFAIAFLFSSSISPSPQCFWTDCRKLIGQHFNLSYQGGVGQDLTHFLGASKSISVKIVPEVFIQEAHGT